MKTLITASLIGLCATAASAENDYEWSVGAGLSTLGANLEAQYRFDPSFAVRGIAITGVDVDFDESDDDFNVEGDAKLGAVALLGDYYPNQGNWRVSGGLLFSSSEIEASGTVDIDGVSEAANVSAEFKNNVSPTLTTAYEWGFAKGWTLTPEAGVIFTGGIDLSVDAAGTTSQSDIDADEDIQDAISDAADLKVLPYISLTVSYRF